MAFADESRASESPEKVSSGSRVHERASAGEKNPYGLSDEALAGFRASEERWYVALEATGDGVWEYDLENETVFLSRRSREILGYDDGELTVPLAERTIVIHPDDLERATRSMHEHFEERTPDFSLEYRVRHKDGHYVWVHARGKCIARSPEGKPLRVVGTHRDMTEHQKARELLEHREALLREFIQHTPAAIAILDREMRYVRTSQRWLSDYGLGDQDIIGRSHYEVFPDIPERWKQVHQRALQGTVERNDEDPFLREDGHTEWLMWEVRPWYEAPGKIGGVIFFTQVITSRKTLELELAEKNKKLAESNEELEQFAYVASHDLQEPLRAIAGCTQLLAQQLEGTLDEDSKVLMKHVTEGASRMRALIEGLLGLSRVNAPEHAIAVDTVTLARRAVANLHAAIASSRARVVVDDLPKVVADPTQVVQLFQNLVGNALKYRGPDDPLILVRHRFDDAMVVISVQDNGIGIDEKYFDKIFGIFQRLHTREEYPGTGIGLALCRKIVEKHGGRIWVESKPSLGSTFFFTLPKG